MHSTSNAITPESIDRLPLLRALTSEALERVARQARAISLSRGEVLIKRGMALQGMYGVLAGNLKIYLLSCDGDERIVRLLQPGDSFGEAIMFNDIPSPVYAQALNDCSLAYFPKPCIIDTLTQQPDFVFSMLQSMSGLMRELVGDLENCCLRNARQRLAHYLLTQANAGPSPDVEVRLPTSKAAVASTLNLSAETFSRELHQLAHAGLIAINRRHISIRDKAGLERLIFDYADDKPDRPD